MKSLLVTFGTVALLKSIELGISAQASLVAAAFLLGFCLSPFVVGLFLPLSGSRLPTNPPHDTPNK